MPDGLPAIDAGVEDDPVAGGLDALRRRDLAGRAHDFAEEPVAQMTSLVPMIADGLWPHLAQPFAFFGHSMGALLGFEGLDVLELKD